MYQIRRSFTTRSAVGELTLAQVYCKKIVLKPSIALRLYLAVFRYSSDRSTQVLHNGSERGGEMFPPKSSLTTEARLPRTNRGLPLGNRLFVSSSLFLAFSLATRFLAIVTYLSPSR